MTLLLGPPSSGKTTLLLALAGKLDPDLKVETFHFQLPFFYEFQFLNLKCLSFFLNLQVED